MDGNVLALVGDRMIEGAPVDDWPLGAPITAAIDGEGVLRAIGRGPRFELTLAAPP